MKKRLVFLALLLVLSGCTPKEVIYDYDDFSSLSNWDQVHNLEQGYFYVYVYSEYCVACDNIKQQVLTYFYESQKEEDIPVYLVNYYLVDNEPPFDFTYTPTLVVMEGDSIVEIFDTQEGILDFIAGYNP